MWPQMPKCLSAKSSELEFEKVVSVEVSQSQVGSRVEDTKLWLTGKKWNKGNIKMLPSRTTLMLWIWKPIDKLPKADTNCVATRNGRNVWFLPSLPRTLHVSSPHRPTCPLPLHHCRMFQFHILQFEFKLFPPLLGCWVSAEAGHSLGLVLTVRLPGGGG